MERDLTSRRHFISAGAIGLTTSIAGCSINDSGTVEDSDPINTDSPPENDTQPDGPNNELPDDPPASFRAPTIDYTYHELPVWREDPDPANLTSINHQDNSIFSIEIQDSSTATATLQQTNVARAINLKLQVRNANGEFQTTPSTTLSPTAENTFEDHVVEFDLSGITLPRGAGSICELVGIDTHPDDDNELIFKRHQFVGIPHKNGVNWINTERVNHSYYREDGSPRHDQPRGVTGRPNESPAGHIEHSDGDDERTVFLAARTSVNGEVFGVSAHVEHEPYNRYINGSRTYQRAHGIRYECYYATDISHHQELATKTHDAISGIGITGPRERISALGDLVQMIPYEIQHEAGSTVVLYEKAGDCSEKSGLMSGIMQNDPWNMMPAFIDCEIGGTRHFTIGINVDNYDGSADNDFTVAPTDSQLSNGFIDTEYAFFDMTYDSDIGERTSGVEGRDGGPIVLWDEGDFGHNSSHLGSRPDY
jgi:hypothetical protein